MSKLSVVILTKNEEKNILDCLESFRDVPEIIIVDDNSEDRTIEVIKNLKLSNIKIYSREINSDFSKQRNFALSKAKNEWVFFVDSDERASGKLLSEIDEKIDSDEFDGLFMKRKDKMWGKVLNYGETGKIKLLRVGRKDKGMWKGKVHETWDIKGKMAYLENSLYHFPHPTIREFIKEVSFYSTLRAEELYRSGVKVSFLDIIIYPKAKFWVNYILKLGFLDGMSGFLVAVVMSFHSFLVRSKLWLLTKK